MRLKYYLRGLGTGIIFTSIILAIIYSYRTTDAKIIERAKELGMITGEVSGESELDNTTPFEEEESGEEMSSFANQKRLLRHRRKQVKVMAIRRIMRKYCLE